MPEPRVANDRPPVPSEAARPAGEPPPGSGRVLATYLVLLVLAVLVAVWGAFLVPLRVGGVQAPVSLVIAVAGNLLLGRSGARVLGRRAGAAGPGVAWFVVVVMLSPKRTEGDLVLANSLVPMLFLLLGAVAAAVAVVLPVPRAGAEGRGAT